MVLRDKVMDRIVYSTFLFHVVFLLYKPKAGYYIQLTGIFPVFSPVRFIVKPLVKNSLIAVSSLVSCMNRKSIKMGSAVGTLLRLSPYFNVISLKIRQNSMQGAT